MRHRKSVVKLGRTASHRNATLANLPVVIITNINITISARTSSLAS